MSSSVNGLPGLSVELAKKKIRLNQLARQLGVTPEHLSGVKNGNRPASLPLSIQASKILGCTVDDLLTDYAQGAPSDA